MTTEDDTAHLRRRQVVSALDDNPSGALLRNLILTRSSTAPVRFFARGKETNRKVERSGSHGIHSDDLSNLASHAQETVHDNIKRA